MTRQQTPADLCNARDVCHAQHGSAASDGPSDSMTRATEGEQQVTRVLVRPTIVVGSDAEKEGTSAGPSAGPAAHASAGLLTLRIGSPDPAFPLMRPSLAIPNVPSDAEELIRTILRTRLDDDDTDSVLLDELGDLSKTQRVEPDEFLDTVALRELALPPEVERRLPPPPPSRQARASAPRRQPPPLAAAARAVMVRTPPHALHRTIKHALPATRLTPEAIQQPGLLSRLGARSRLIRVTRAWVWAAGLGACSMCLAYVITDRIVSEQPERIAVLREQTPRPQHSASMPRLPQAAICAPPDTQTQLQAGANAP